MSSESAGEDVSQMLAESNTQPNTEQMVPQSKVNELVANAKLVSAEKARREAEAQYQQQLASMQQTQPQGMGGMQAVQQPDLQSMVAETVKKEREAERQLLLEQEQRKHVDELAAKYSQAMDEGASLYPDFKEVTGKYNPVKFPEVTLMAAQMENTADIVYELNKNPMKLTHLKQLAEIDPNLALDEMRKLSASIKRNDEAAQSTSRAPNPLSKLKTSIAGSDSGRKTIADWKRIYKA